MRSNFAHVLPLLFEDEGGYCNDAGDPGGPTKWGIIYDDLIQWRGLPRTASKASRIAAVQAVTKDEAAAIYKAKYWDALRCDDLPAGVDYAVFDYGVNSGIRRAARVLQRIVGAKADGVVGGMTLAAVGRMAPEKIIDGLSDERLGFLQRLRTWRIFGRGWKRRVVHVHADALLMAREASKADFVPGAVPNAGNTERAAQGNVTTVLLANPMPGVATTGPFPPPATEPVTISTALKGEA